MATIEEIKNIKISDVAIGQAQTRTREVSKDIEELIESIDKQGLLQPIMVNKSDKEGKYEIILGQRRLLACQRLQKKEILAAILSEKVSAIQAKIISFTENLVRRDPCKPDCIDVCTDLYKKYGSMKDVAKETGLPYHKVCEYVKYDRLEPEMRELVDTKVVNMKTALRAQDAASTTGTYDKDKAITLAKEMSTLDPSTQKKVVQTLEEEPSSTIDDVLEHAKSGANITRININLGAVEYQSLKSYAKTEGSTVEDAATTLITEGLATKGVLEE